MRLFGAVLLSLLVIQTSSAGQTPDTEDVSVSMVRLGERVAVVRVGTTYVTNVIALAAGKGLVVIDTNNIPSLAPEIRKLIEKEFDRDDFTYVINTHWHWDHTNGNFAYPEATIVGHERCVPALQQFEAGLPEYLPNRRQWIDTLEEQTAGLDPDSEEARWNRDIILTNRILFADFEKEVRIVPQNLTFNDRLTLDLGDMTLRMVFFGTAHTDTDILIHVPEERLLMIGDLFASGWLPSITEQADIPHWFESLDYLFENGIQVDRIIGGHHSFMSPKEFSDHLGYVKTLWEGIAGARAEGKILREVKEMFSLEERFPELSHLRHVWQGIDYHPVNIETVWKLLIPNS